jgi:hypothetical protein
MNTVSTVSVSSFFVLGFADWPPLSSASSCSAGTTTPHGDGGSSRTIRAAVIAAPRKKPRKSLSVYMVD